MRRRNIIIFFVIAAIGAAFDMVTKGLAFKYITWGDADVSVIEGFFSFGRTINRGIVFGIGQEWGSLFLWISILAVPIISWIYLRMKNPTWTVTGSLGLILGGTLGNLTDRLFSALGQKALLGIHEAEYGGVRDFLRFDFGDYTFPLFNIADSCICVGVAILSVEMMFFDDTPKKKKKPVDPIATDETVPVPVSHVPETGETQKAPTVGDHTANIPRPDEPRAVEPPEERDRDNIDDILSEE